MTRVDVRSLPARLLILALGASTCVGLLVVALGLWAMAEDASAHGEDLDGLGLFFGQLMVAAGLLWSLPHVILALWLLRNRRRGRSLAPVGVASGVLAGALLSLLLQYVASGAAELTTLLAPVCGCVLVLATGVLVVAVDSSR